MKRRNSPVTLVLAPLLYGVAWLCVAILPVQAVPEGGHVVAGEIEIARGSQQRLDIVQRSARGAIDWQSFNIGAGEHVNFAQPSAEAVTLNRVMGGDPSAIFGRLTSNGRVFLVNPNGVLFGATAQVDVGGLLATTAGLSNEDFLADRLVFDRSGSRSASIVNQGRISTAAGGLVALVAPGVENSGAINARLGRVTLAAGDTFTLDLYGDQLVTLAVSDAKLEEIAGAGGGAGRGPSGSFVRNSGVIAADGGRVWLTTNAAREVVDGVVNLSGSIRARSLENRNGEIVLVGQRVEVAAGAVLDVSAAEARGEGGSILIRSETDTQFAGRATAGGGALGGDGGLIEISGNNRLTFRGDASATAPHGRPGTVLFDPPDLRIGVGLDVEPDAISRMLQAGTSVTQAATNDLFVNGRIDGRGGVAGAKLTLNAGRNVELNDDILTNAGAVEVTAAAGKITMGAGSATTMSGGLGAAILTGGGKVTFNAAGDISIENLVTTGGVAATSTGGNVILNQKLVSNGPVDLSGKEVVLKHSIFTSNQTISLGRSDGLVRLNPANDETNLDANGKAPFGKNALDQTDLRKGSGLIQEGSGKAATSSVDVFLESRQITLNTGANGANIVFRGKVTIADDLVSRNVYFLNGENSPFASPISKEPHQPSVALSLAANNGEVAFQNGIGVRRTGDDEILKSVDLVVRSASKVSFSGETVLSSLQKPSSLSVSGTLSFKNIIFIEGAEGEGTPPTASQAVSPSAATAGVGGVVIHIPPQPVVPTVPNSSTTTQPVVSSGSSNLNVENTPPTNIAGVVDLGANGPPPAEAGPTSDVLVIGGGRGVGRKADLGKNPAATGPAPEVFAVAEIDFNLDGGAAASPRDGSGRDQSEEEKKRKTPR